VPTEVEPLPTVLPELPLGTWVADKVEHVASGLSFLPKTKHSVPFVLLTMLYWGANSAGIQLMAHGSGFADFTYPEACVTMGVVALGILVPNAPGFFGTYQLSFYAALAVFYPTDKIQSDGAACVLFIYTAQLLITLGAGLLGLLLARTSLSETMSASASGEDLAEDPPPA